MKYRGIALTLWDDPEDASRFTAGKLEVTAATWLVSGAKIGQTAAFVRSRLGRPNTIESDPRTKHPVWYYEMSDESPGNTKFIFGNGRLFRIVAMYLMC